MGFLQRLRAGSYHFIEESFELKQGLLYYLYFKDVVKKNRIGNGNPSLTHGDANDSEPYVYSPP